MMKAKAKTFLSITVYRSLSQAWKTLTAPELKNLPQVVSLVNTCQDAGIIVVKNGEVIPISSEVPKMKHGTTPFVVVEGLDGTGKTTLTNFLSTKLNMRKLCTPPKVESLQKSRSFFDSQNESIRRAYYSVGNYLAAKDVINSAEPVVMDRYWHSTAAYAFAHFLKTENASSEHQIEKSDFIWPADLLQPNLVIFLTVSEEERVRRHTNRRNFTNTKEEKTLAEDSEFRKNLVQSYQSISGPKFEQLVMDGELSDSQQKILNCVTGYFPDLVKN